MSPTTQRKGPSLTLTSSSAALNKPLASQCNVRVIQKVNFVFLPYDVQLSAVKRVNLFVLKMLKHVKMTANHCFQKGKYR